MDFNTSDPLSFDEQLVAEKIGIHDARNFSQRNNDLNSSLKLALMKEELASRERMIQKLQASQKREREKFTVNEQESQPNTSSKVFSLSTTDTLIIFIVILLIVCVLQYLTIRDQSSEIMNMIKLLCSTNNKNDAKT